MARQAKVKTLFCTHHEPTRSDDALEAAFAQALADNPQPPEDGPDIRLAREGEYFRILTPCTLPWALRPRRY